jgi:maleamate amidohydrolase
MLDYNEEVAKVEQLRDNPKIGLGEKPAVVVVDFQLAFTTHGQSDTESTLRATAKLLEKARAVGVPVVYLTVAYDTMDDVPLAWRREGEIFSRCQRGLATGAINPIVAMEPADLLVEKRHASGFYDTDLDEKLKVLGVDTLLMCGTSTSGCVRSTAVDGAARSYRVMIVDECCDDWRPLSTAAALYDLADRYADVVHLEPVLEYLDKVGAPATAGATWRSALKTQHRATSRSRCAASPVFLRIIFSERSNRVRPVSCPARCFLGQFGVAAA